MKRIAAITLANGTIIVGDPRLLWVGRDGRLYYGLACVVLVSMLA